MNNNHHKDNIIRDEIQGRDEPRKETYSNVRRLSNADPNAVARPESEPYLGYGEGVVTMPNAAIRDSSKPDIIFFGNGPLSEYTLTTLTPHVNILFHAKTAADLPTVAELKRSHPNAFGILASFGVLIKSDLLELFEPEGIINLHPSKLPEYRGASPIETAILNGDTSFSYSIMKLVKAMDAGPLYHQDALTNLPIDKTAIYQALATAGAEWIVNHLQELRSLTPTPQSEQGVSYTTKLTKDMSMLHPDQFPASEIFRQIVAYQGFPKPKYTFYGKTCIILQARLVSTDDIICDPSIAAEVSSPLMLKCADRNFVAIERLQPEGKKPMDAKSFINGYGKKAR